MKNITITLTRYKEPNWLLHEALDSLSTQKNIKAEVLFLDQFENNETEEKCKNITNENIRFNYKLIPAIGLSYARNEAIRISKTNIVLFLDTDAISHEMWAYELCNTLSKNDVGIAGGKIVPKWHKKPILITKSNIICEQYSILDFGDSEQECKKVVGANFGIDLGLLGDEAYFDEKLGRRDGILIGGEEVDLCARAKTNGIKTYYNGQALVYHQILPERITYAWILKRLYFAGMSRALRGGSPDPTTRKRHIWDYMFVPFILPVYTLGYIRGRGMVK